ncbi:GNAT family N-acetyltransferase [Alkalibacterium sp.]|nr:MAG: N-acetyltransferase [Alkalibacterium sp.]
MVEIECNPIRKEELEKGMELLMHSFKEEAITSRAFDFTKENTEQILVKLSILKAEAYLQSGSPILVAKVNGEIAGIAIVKEKSTLTKRQMLDIIWPTGIRALPLITKLNWRKAAKLGRAIKEAENIPEPFITLEAIAVHPDYRGFGVGKALMKEVQAIAAEEGQTIYLYTGDKKNEEIYRHLGYGTLEQRAVEDIVVYHMIKKAV